MKRILLSLFVGLIGLINFGYCEDIYISGEGNGTNHTRDYDLHYINNTNDSLVFCVSVSSNYGYNIQFYYGGTKGNFGILSNPSCFLLEGSYNDIFISPNSTQYTFSYNFYRVITPGNCHVMTSLECQTEYNLIPVSSVDQNYCVNNGLCPSSDCPSLTGDYTGDLLYSNIYINNILHPGKQNIFINIPDYITWDYSQNEVDFNVYVGSGYDVDYINSIVDINSYRPTSDDFTNVFVSGLTLVFPYIFVALLILFIWKLLKRIFK